MRRSARRHISPALVISLIALVLAAGGTSFAAAPVAFVAKALGLSSKQKKQVTSIADSQIASKGPKLSVLYAASAGTATTATNATNATNATSATNATTATNATNAAELGGAAASAYQQYTATLPSGVTETGDWGGGYTAATTNDGYRVVVSFRTPLAAGLTNVVYVSGASATHCSGVGHADPGYLCVYQGYVVNANTPTSSNIFNPETASGTSSTSGAYGFSILLSAAGSGLTTVSGTYAVTAP